MIPHLLEQKAEQIVIIGGPNSNNVLGLTQLAIENGIKPILFLREAGSEKIQGNRWFIEMLVDSSQIYWVPRKQWEQVTVLAQEFADEQRKNKICTTVIPEGACMEAALSGAMTLASDIVENELENNIAFDHIFVDAGTGLQAIALLLGLLKHRHKALVHIVLLADTPEIFREKLLQFSANVPLPRRYELHHPKTAPSFGSVNRTVMNEISLFARGEGIFLDPVYSAKLVFTGRKLVEDFGLTGNILFVHSGGGLSLAGFQAW